MIEEQSSRKAVVRRITVDERLADDLIRLVVCRLVEGVEEFYDRRGEWGRERESWARPRNYAEKLGAPPDNIPAWDSLMEGQVFLSGEFEVVGERDKPRWFRACPGKQEFLRLDSVEEHKEGLKHLYSVLLVGGQRDDHSD
jgi:hypothetical protein